MQARSRVNRPRDAASYGGAAAAKADEDADAVSGPTGLPGTTNPAATADLSGVVPRQHGQTLPGYVLSPLAKMALARARMRTVVPLDVVRFVAACPACGADCEWTQEREETRVRSYQNCPCTP